MADAESLVQPMKGLAVEEQPKEEQGAEAGAGAAPADGNADDDGEVAATREVATALQEAGDGEVRVEVQGAQGLLDMSLKGKDGQQITWERLFAGLVSEELSAQLCRACGEKGWAHPARVQRCLRVALHPDKPGVLVHAKNGSGKTGCFALACLARIDKSLKKPQAVVVCPNRLVVKNAVDTIRKLASQLVDADGQPAISVAEAVKGKKFAPEITDQVIVATPGRLMMLVNAGKAAAKASGGRSRGRRRGGAKKERSSADLSQVKVLAVDEADEMMELSEDALRSLVRLTPQAQTMLFSASFDELTGGAVKAFTDDLLRAKQRDPFRLTITDVTIPRLTQFLVRLPGHETRNQWIQRMLPILARTGPVFLFANTKRQVRACGELAVPGVKLSWVSSDREGYHKVLDDFASRKLNAVVSTNMGARGVDIANLNVVVNLWPCTKPGGANGQVDHKAFQHRCGRTARFGRPGVVLNIATAEEEPLVRELVSGRSVFRYELQELPTDGQQALDAINAALDGAPADEPAAAGGGGSA